MSFIIVFRVLESLRGDAELYKGQYPASPMKDLRIKLAKWVKCLLGEFKGLSWDLGLTESSEALLMGSGVQICACRSMQ